MLAVRYPVVYLLFYPKTSQYVLVAVHIIRTWETLKSSEIIWYVHCHLIEWGDGLSRRVSLGVFPPHHAVGVFSVFPLDTWYNSVRVYFHPFCVI